MVFIILILLICLFVLFGLYFHESPKTKSKKVYNAINGHEKTPEIISAIKVLAEEPKPEPENKLMVADMVNFNLHQNADEIYAEALQLAIYENDPIAFNINDRLHPLEPLITIIPIPFPHFIPHFAAGEMRVGEMRVGEMRNEMRIDEPPSLIEKKKVVRSDPQNVHDSNVVAQLREKCEKIKGTTFDPVLYADFKKITKHGDLISKIESVPCLHEHLDVTDEEVLRAVISRGKHTWDPLESNLGNINENVCLTGRIGQIIDALTIVDPIGKPIVTIDIMRKEIMEDSANYLREKGFFEGSEINEQEFEEYLKKKYEHLCAPEIFNKLLIEVKAGL